MKAATVAVLDANVLYPVSLCDTLLRCALVDLYLPLWSNEILAEMVRNLIADGRATAERANRRAEHMQQAFPQATVRGYESLIPKLGCHEKDRHVLAAAIRAQAQLIVTSNVGDFPAPALAPYAVTAQHPDQFLQGLLAQDRSAVVQAVREQVLALRNPPMTTDQVLSALGLHVPGFAAAIRRALTNLSTE